MPGNAMDHLIQIVDESALRALADELSAADAIALDTEFFWERSYYPVLGLVQIAAAPDRCWLVDAVALSDLSPLAPVLSAPGITKVLHDAPQDLQILHLATGAIPRNIFDTRLAAGFAGHSSVASLQALLGETLGIALDKEQTRSNWLRRPLSDAQLHYAAEDVVHLLPLRRHLLAHCRNDTVRTWLREELNGLDDPELCREPDPRDAYRRVKGMGRLDRRGLAVLRELAEWREMEARERDRPRRQVLADAMMIATAEHRPADRRQLYRLRETPRRLPRHNADAILAAVSRGEAVPDADCPTRSRRSGRTRRMLDAALPHLRRHVDTACAAHGIDGALAGARADLERFLEALADDDGSHADLPLGQGWRAAITAGFELPPPTGEPDDRQTNRP